MEPGGHTFNGMNDLLLIARDFYLHEFADIAQYEDLIEAVKLLLSR
jgi:hypothetical protein